MGGLAVARVHIDVMLREEILDPQGQALERALPSLGFTDVREVRVGKHIIVDVAAGDDLDERIADMAARLLANPVIEEFTYRIEG